MIGRYRWLSPLLIMLCVRSAVPAQSPLGATTPVNTNFIFYSGANPVYSPEALKPLLRLKQDGVERQIVGVGSNSCDESSKNGMTILLLDSTHFAPQPLSSHGGIVMTTEALKHEVSTVLKHLPADTRLAIYTVGSEFRVVRDFERSDTTSPAVFAPLTSEQIRSAAAVFEMKTGRFGDIFQLFPDKDKLVALMELESIADHVAPLPGRKTLVWFSTSLALSIPPPEGMFYYAWFATMTALARANVALYTVQSAGVNFPGLSSWARMTGGRVYFKEFKRALSQALAEAGCTYQVRWIPGEPTAGPVHNLSISLQGSSVKLLSPDFYSENVLPQKLELRLAAAEAGASTPLQLNAIQLTSSIQRRDNKSYVSTSVNLNGVALSNEDACLHGSLDIIYAYFGNHNERLRSGHRSEVRIQIPESESKSWLSKPFVVTQELDSPPEATLLKVIARDVNSGAMGSAAVTLPAATPPAP